MTRVVSAHPVGCPAQRRPRLSADCPGRSQLGRGRRTLLVAASGLVVLLGLEACGEPAATLDSAATERAVDRVIGDRIGPPVAEVQCPEEIARGSGKRFSCRAVLEDGAGTIRLRVRQVDDDGRLQAEPIDAVVDTDVVAEDLRATLVRAYLRGFTVDCGKAGPKVVEPDTKFTCDAKDSAGRREVAVTVVDAAGTLRYDVGD